MNSLSAVCVVWLSLIYFLKFSSGFNQDNLHQEIIKYRNEVDSWLHHVNKDLRQFNAISAKITWDTMIGKGSDEMTTKVDYVVQIRNDWKNKVCESKTINEWLTEDQARQLYLFCRGPKFTKETAKAEMDVLNEMHNCYQVEICFEKNEPTALAKLSTPGKNTSTYPQQGECLQGEPDLERLIKRTDLNPDQLKWIWLTWHNNIGLPMREVFPRVVKMQNFAARANGYSDMGAVWREELEIVNLEDQVLGLYEEIKPLYLALHAVVRHKLLQKYGILQVDPTGPIPIHLLGNMWGQNWSPLLELLAGDDILNLDERLTRKDWSVKDMVLKAEDFYTSMGLPHMTDKFWKYSVFEQNETSGICHGTAANLFQDDDYRILHCAKINMEDFYVIHHEMGHIEYNMAYKDEPTIFQEGTNSAFHETIGDSIMHGVMSMQHLYRLGVLDDENLLDEKTDRILLLQQALSKIPEMPFALLIDIYRWRIFNGGIREEEMNGKYWEMNVNMRGLTPPQFRGESYFDAGAKFHIPDNTPYIRYFLSGILQLEVFKGLCELAVYGKFINEDEAEKIQLHKCDIYGCKKCGKVLSEAMSLGASVHWTRVLKILTGKSTISTKAFLEYYGPVYKWLMNYIKENDLPLNW